MKLEYDGKKIFVKMHGIGVQLDWLVAMLLQLVGNAADELVKGEELGKDGLKLIVLAYTAAKLYDNEAVKKTETQLDDEALEKLIAILEDTMQDANITFPILHSI